MTIPLLREETDWFPEHSLAHAAPNGLLAMGGDLSIPRLLAAYQQGIFPWYAPGEPILWWSLDPRCVLFPKQLHVNRTFQKILRKPWRLGFNKNFLEVVKACATSHGETWISPEMQAAYLALHQAGAAHSIEVYWNTTLVGGLYGVQLGKVFFAESMFHTMTGASKVAIHALCQRSDVEIIDCQFETPHLTSLGCILLSRADFLNQLLTALSP